MAAEGAGGLQTSPPKLVDAFETGTAWLLTEAGVARRKMFGYPACFVDGHLFTSLFRDRWVVRLPDEDRAELAALGGEEFSPMLGRPMAGYLLLPRGMATPEAAHPSIERALAHARTLPAKRKR